ncbi:hypothetical protein EJ04DRAFT_523411 [Polyplosphaeria fusca]|uniref:Ankyrin repeat protein n=1 Tax=Polyplosphaeria fusca TaxID=682080 RepID=A0A9P4R0T1_9PLEO|nr:hypothetical protein EJ04DRAFT_523411 [Polyplosphaeria fusca]
MRIAQTNPKVDSDGRKAAAAFELCICYASGFGVDADKVESVKLLVQAARLQEFTAQSLCYRLLTALDQPIHPIAEEVDSWLVQAAAQGSWTAVQSLKKLASINHEASFEAYRDATIPFDPRAAEYFQEAYSHISFSLLSLGPSFYTTPQGKYEQTFLHWAAINGILEVFRGLSSNKLLTSSDFDVQNATGNTPLVYACRSANKEIAVHLIEAGGFFKESWILPLLLPSLVITAATIGDGELILCFRNLKSPIAGAIRVMGSYMWRQRTDSHSHDNEHIPLNTSDVDIGVQEESVGEEQDVV